ncbi:MAG TPA: helix-turn-helix domain-containing protein [Candidatus Eisenbergiella merdavium]|uniref:Helix-turn-helix domain-containing protein n=1 Tax=Candidatus Eisenbergiella merdavium TaxID=2838551 RepID=A0A9D2NBL0_9FIRM|nr:helix-turn-helix domain-containing protein [Candidatus Eisenbergiella merdavium]
MRFVTIGFVVLYVVFWIAVFVLAIYLLSLIIRALKKYINSGEVRKEKKVIRKSLGELLKENRLRCKMTQEFVAETLGVSRQAVSKWENGTADPSTSNLLALSRLFGISAEELLKSVNEETKREDRMEEGSGDGK